MEKTKDAINKYWQIITAIALVIFNVGYTIAQLERMPTRIEMKEEIKKEIYLYDQTLRDKYIEIEKVPGLSERLNSIDQGLKDLKSSLNKIEDKVFSLKK